MLPFCPDEMTAVPTATETGCWDYSRYCCRKQSSKNGSSYTVVVKTGYRFDC